MRYLRGGLIVLGASLLLAPAAGAFVLKAANGHRMSVTLRANQAQAHLAAAKGGASNGQVLQYHGGPVLHSETAYLIFWEPGGTHVIAPSSKNVLTQYLTDASRDSGGTDNVYGVLPQYTDLTGIGADYQQATPRVIDDTQAFPEQSSDCSLAPGMTACVSDAQLQAEIARLIAKKHLASGTGADAPIYFMITPTDVNVCITSGECSSNFFCAYHFFFDLSGAPVLYASVPFSVWANGSIKACQDDGTSLYQTPAGPSHGDQGYQIADNLSHELSETITDPGVNAWFSGNGSEVGDLCEAFAPISNIKKDVSSLAYFPTLSGSASAGTLTDQLFSGDYYYTQTEWSNARNACSATPTT
jgi:hypothetical protein